MATGSRTPLTKHGAEAQALRKRATFDREKDGERLAEKDSPVRVQPSYRVLPARLAQFNCVLLKASNTVQCRVCGKRWNLKKFYGGIGADPRT